MGWAESQTAPQLEAAAGMNRVEIVLHGTGRDVVIECALLTGVGIEPHSTQHPNWR
jgi:hypothetical protein